MKWKRFFRCSKGSRMPLRNGAVIGMVIWLNGCPGSGKTAVAREIAHLTHVAIIDPERIGRIIQRITQTPDYQYSKMWQFCTTSLIRLSARLSRPVIVPMTLLDPRVRKSVIGPLRVAGQISFYEVLLEADQGTLVDRINRRGGSHLRWCLDSLPRFSHYGRPQTDLVLDTREFSVTDIAFKVLQATAGYKAVNHTERVVMPARNSRGVQTQAIVQSPQPRQLRSARRRHTRARRGFLH